MYVTKQQMGPIGPAAHAGLTRERLFGSAQIKKKKEKGEVDVKTEIYPKILSGGSGAPEREKRVQHSWRVAANETQKKVTGENSLLPFGHFFSLIIFF